MRTRGGYPTNRLIADHGDWQEWDISTRSHPGAVLKIDTADMLRFRAQYVVRLYADEKNGPVYARFTYKEKKMYLHRFLIGGESTRVVDHINHDGLDNRRSNIRAVTSSQNLSNRVRGANNTSGITGLHWSKKRTKWETYITVRGTRIRLGHFADKEEAIRVRKAAEQAHFGEFTYAGAQS